MVAFMRLSKRMRRYLELAQSMAPYDKGATRRLVSLLKAYQEDCHDEFGMLWYYLDDVADSLEEYVNDGKILDLDNVFDAREGGWHSEDRYLTFMQYLLVYQRRAFLFLTCVPLEKAAHYLMDKDKIVCGFAKWRHKSML